LDSGTPAGGGWCAFSLSKADKKIAENHFFLFDLYCFTVRLSAYGNINGLDRGKSLDLKGE
jgi:hypothetical protein